MFLTIDIFFFSESIPITSDVIWFFKISDERLLSKQKIIETIEWLENNLKTFSP